MMGVAAVIFIMASVPPVSRDELTHHLAVPKLYIAHGGIYEIPNVIFSYYPMSTKEMVLIIFSEGFINYLLARRINILLG